jgi:Skp family chaperone for outer membrane proteins
MKIVTIGTTAGLLMTVLYAAVAGQGTGPSGPPIRYIVSQRVLAEATDARAEMTRFQSVQKEKAAELRAKQQALDATRLQIARASDAAERARLVEQEQKARADFEQSTAQAQQDLQALQRQMQVGLQARMRTVLDDLLKGQDVQLVLNADAAVVWAAPGADLTSAVIERMNTGRVAPADSAN